MFPLQIRFTDGQHAYDLFGSFPPQDVDYIEGWERKRVGDSQVILLHLESAVNLDDFLSLCRRHPNVVEVIAITEDEFRRAPSNAI